VARFVAAGRSRHRWHPARRSPRSAGTGTRWQRLGRWAPWSVVSSVSWVILRAGQTQPRTQPSPRPLRARRREASSRWASAVVLDRTGCPRRAGRTRQLRSYQGRTRCSMEPRTAPEPPRLTPAVQERTRRDATPRGTVFVGSPHVSSVIGVRGLASPVVCLPGTADTGIGWWGQTPGVGVTRILRSVMWVT